jgi:hypothetical protein
MEPQDRKHRIARLVRLERLVAAHWEWADDRQRRLCRAFLDSGGGISVVRDGQGLCTISVVDNDPPWPSFGSAERGEEYQPERGRPLHRMWMWSGQHIRRRVGIMQEIGEHLRALGFETPPLIRHAGAWYRVGDAGLTEEPTLELEVSDAA